jgi:hypothetical protein
MPTIAHLTEASLPEHPIDGKNVWPLIKGEAHAKNPNKYYAFSNGSDFQGVIRGDGHWKLHLPHTYRTLVDPANDGQAGKYRQARIEVSLFDLEKDPYETTNVAAQNPKIFSELHQLAIKHREKFYTK